MAVDEKTARVRDLLSSYYGLPGAQISAPSSSSGTPVTPARQPRSISLDSTAFDGDRYLNQLLKGTKLRSLLQKHVDLSTEIKSLDSDMQMLVYENYNKFISATDTIRMMKSNLDGMDSKVHTLRETIEKVADRNASVNSKLQQRRDQMDEFGSVRELLIRLQAVFELPKRLRAAIDQGAIELAVDQYADASELLKLFGHKGAFRQVNAEVQSCAQELGVLLKKRLVLEKGEAVETIQMIRKLGEPVENLQEEYLDCMRQRLGAILGDAEALAGSQEAPVDDADQPQTAGHEVEIWGYQGWQSLSVPKFVVELDQRFITELAAIAVAFTELFDSTGRSRLVQMARETFARYCGVLKACLRTASTASASGAARKFEAGPAHQAAPDGSAEKDWGTAQMAQALSTAASDIARLQTLLPELSPQDRAVEVVESTIRHHIGECFLQLERRTFRELSAAGARLQDASPAGEEAVGRSQAQLLLEAYLQVSRVIGGGTVSILQAMSGYEQHSALLKSWKDVFVDLVQGQVQHLLLSLLAGFLRIAGLQPEGSEVSAGADSYQREAASAASLSGTCAPGVLLLLARLADFLEASALVRIMETLALTFPGQGAAAGGDQPPAFVAGEVARRFNVGATSLLEAYVQAQGGRLSLALRRGLESGSRDAKEPRAPRAAFRLLLERLAEAEAQVVHMLDDGGSGTTYRGQEELEGKASGTALERNVARLFHRKTPMFEPLAFNQTSILGGIVRFALKAFIECIRLQTLNRTGLQQLQLDIYFLRQSAPSYVHGPNLTAFHFYLDEALTSAAERSSEQTLLDPPLLERILAASENK